MTDTSLIWETVHGQEQRFLRSCSWKVQGMSSELDMSIDDTLGAQCATSTQMEAIAQNIQVLPETTLKEIAKGPLMHFTLTCRDDQ